jgi:para-aminobenzoate synthetase/4-amino-4-deoxychorismate lyase
MFFRKRDRMIEVKPMKGTSCRGRFLQEDLGNIEALHLCPKNRSENIMIVDMLRNDLGKISSPATVKTKRFFEVERYESLLQMTSTIEGKLKSKVSLYEIFKALFPSGSVTGAPKIKTMQIIDELEKSPRMVYTGSIGFIKPSGDAVFNVAIRTLLIDTKEKIGEMGVGSGIVYDSNPQKEYAECLLKSKFLTDRWADFQLIETMLWEPQKGLFLLKLHMERLSESARYFDFRYNEKAIVEALRKTAAKLDSRKRYRIRFLLDREGGIDISLSDITIENDEKFVTVSDKATDSKDIFLFHKTTNRRFYDEEYKRCKEKGFHDIIFCNQNGEITEGTISNIFIKKGNRYYTPPVHCGLLNGVYRRYILKEKMLPAQEKILYIEDIERAEEIILTNAVRGITKAKLIREESYVKV